MQTRSVSLRKRKEIIPNEELFDQETVEYPKSAMPTIEEENYVFVEEDEILQYTYEDEKDTFELETSLKLWLKSKVYFEEEDLFEALKSGIVRKILLTLKILSKLISSFYSFENLKKVRTELTSKMLDSKFNFRILNDVLMSNWYIDISFDDICNKNKSPVLKALEKLKIEIEKEEEKEIEIFQTQNKLQQDEKSKFRILFEIFILPYIIFYFFFERIKKSF
jgi:hypothetical protein